MRDSCGSFYDIVFFFFSKHNAQLNLLQKTDFYVDLIK